MRRPPQRSALARQLASLLLLALAIGTTAAQESSVKIVGERFSCEGRASGFYADIASGCQMYHMCDEGGRVFTHTCPERTLFQQRTMVCDHWYMVECNGAVAAIKAAAAPARRGPPARASAPAQAQAQVAPLGNAPARKRHSQRVLATFPYQRQNDTVAQSSATRSSSSQDKLESFKISSFPSSTPRSVVSSTATIERVERPNLFAVSPFPYVEKSQEREPPNVNRPVPVVNRAKIERVFKETVLTPPRGEVISQVRYTSISPFREPKAEIQFSPFSSTTPRPTSEASASVIQNQYNNNPFFDSYFRTSFTIEPSSTPTPIQTTTQSIAQREEEDISENKLEIVIPDPRKMFYIPDSNYDAGDASKDEGTLLVIELPGKNAMKFQRVEVTEARNHDCPQCHPSFLLPGLCRPCVLIR